jgi:hypothetical protein
MVTSIQRSLVDRLESFGCHSVQKTARQKKARLVTSVMLRPGKQGAEGAGCSRRQRRHADPGCRAVSLWGSGAPQATPIATIASGEGRGRLKGDGERARESERAGTRASDQASSRLRFTKETAAAGIPPCLSEPSQNIFAPSPGGAHEFSFIYQRRPVAGSCVSGQKEQGTERPRCAEGGNGAVIRAERLLDAGTRWGG